MMKYLLVMFVAFALLTLPAQFSYAQKALVRSVPRELIILDNIQDAFHADIQGFLEGFQYVTFVRQEYPNGKWIYHAIFTDSKPKTSVRKGNIYIFTFPKPNVVFTVSRDFPMMNRINYSSSIFTISAFTVVQTTFESKDFRGVPPR